MVFAAKVLPSYPTLSSSYLLASVSFNLLHHLKQKFLRACRWKKRFAEVLLIIWLISRRPLEPSSDLHSKARLAVVVVTRCYCFDSRGFVQTDWLFFWGRGLVEKPNGDRGFSKYNDIAILKFFSWFYLADYLKKLFSQQFRWKPSWFDVLKASQSKTLARMNFQPVCR